MEEKQKSLPRTLGFTTALMTILGIVIGSGIFFKPYAIFKATGGAPGLGMIAWIVAGVLTMAGALTVSEIATIVPETGGMVTYITKVYGKKLGFLAGWTDSLLYQVGLVAASAVIFGVQATYLLGFSEDMKWMKLTISIAAILFVAFMNTLSAKLSGYFQTIITLGKFIPILVIMIVSFSKGTGHSVVSPIIAPDIQPFNAFSIALLACLFAFDGWMGVGQIAGEMKEPGKDLPKALIMGISIASIVFILMNIAYMWVLPANELMLTETPATQVAMKIFGNNGGKIVAMGILVVVYGTLNGYVFTGARSTYTLAKTNCIPMAKHLQKVNKSGVPANAIWYVSIVACIYCLTGKYDMLTDIAIFVAWIFNTLTFVGVLILRRKQPDLKRDYRVPLYPFTPILAIVGGSYVVFSTLIAQPSNALIGLAVLLLGLPVYAIYSKKNQLSTSQSLQKVKH